MVEGVDAVTKGGVEQALCFEEEPLQEVLE
jgi:hypothetical protein